MLNLGLDIIGGWLVQLMIAVVNLVFHDTDIFNELLNVLNDPESFYTPNGVKNIFPELVKLMSYLGWLFLAILSYAAIIKAISAAYTGSRVENPMRTGIRIIFSAFLVGLSKPALSALSFIQGEISRHLYIGSLGVSELVWGWSWHPGEVFVRFVLVGIVVYSTITALIAFFERVFSFLIFAYTYPIAMAFTANPATAESAKDWLKGVLSQIVMIELSLFFFAMGLKYTNFLFERNTDSAVTPDGMMAFMVGISFMALVKNSEKILNMYNIKTMQPTDALRSITGGAAAAFGAAKLATNLSNKAFNGAKGIRDVNRAHSFPGGSGMKLPGSNIAGGGTFANSANKQPVTTKQLAGAAGASLANNMALPNNNTGSNGAVKAGAKGNPMQLKNLEPLSDKQIKQAFNQSGVGLSDRQAGANGFVSSGLNAFRNNSNEKAFADSYKQAHADRNKAIDKTNDFLDANRGTGKYAGSASATAGVTSGTGNGKTVSGSASTNSAISPKLSNEEAFKAFGGPANFTPSNGNAAYLKGANGNDGVMISGTFTDRNGTTRAGNLVYGSEFTGKSDGNSKRTLGGKTGSAFDLDDKAVYKVNDTMVAYEARPHIPSSVERQADGFTNSLMSDQENLLNQTAAFGYGSSGYQEYDDSRTEKTGIPGITFGNSAAPSETSANPSSAIAEFNAERVSDESNQHLDIIKQAISDEMFDFPSVKEKKPDASKSSEMEEISKGDAYEGPSEMDEVSQRDTYEQNDDGYNEELKNNKRKKHKNAEEEENYNNTIS